MKGIQKLVLSIATLCTSYSSIDAQTLPSSIATFKNNMPSAYTLTMDDFGDGNVNGIENYADTICFNRGIVFTFGAIVGSCDAQDWVNAKRLISHGHEIMNHSWNHKCGNPNTPWCVDLGLWTEKDFGVELLNSTNTIEAQAGKRPRFFIYPYDQFTDAANTYLKNIGYLGSRTGTYDGFNLSNVQNPFQTAFWVYRDTSTPSELNSKVDETIQGKHWSIREVHGVQDGSWGSVPVADFRNHINYLKQKQDAKQLWVGNATQVISYIMQRNNYTPTSTYSSTTKKVTIAWNQPGFDMADSLGSLDFTSPVTINVNMASVGGNLNNLSVSQNGLPITNFTVSGTQLSINAYPHKGTITVSGFAACNLCISSQSTNQTLVAGNNLNLSVVADGNGTLTYTWKKGNTVIGTNSSSLSIASVTTADAGSYTVTVSNGSATVTSTPIQVTVLSQEPYNNTPTAIPGKLELENYDLGGEGIAYHDLTTTNEGTSVGTTIRTTEAVDIEACTEGGHNLGYTLATEWVEYTVNVASTSMYDLTFRHAGAGGTGALKIYIDDVDVTGNITLPATGGWQTWKNKASQLYLTQGIHILKIEIVTGDFNLNYINFVKSIVSGNTTTAFSDDMNVIPNPFNNVFKVTVNANYEGTLIDGLGRTVWTGSITPDQYISPNITKAGVYTLLLQNENEVQVMRIVKQ